MFCWRCPLHDMTNDEENKCYQHDNRNFLKKAIKNFAVGSGSCSSSSSAQGEITEFGCLLLWSRPPTTILNSVMGVLILVGGIVVSLLGLLLLIFFYYCWDNKKVGQQRKQLVASSRILLPPLVGSFDVVEVGDATSCLLWGVCWSWSSSKTKDLWWWRILKHKRKN